MTAPGVIAVRFVRTALGGGGAPPREVFRGFIDSSRIQIGCWPPAGVQGVSLTYKVWRDRDYSAPFFTSAPTATDVQVAMADGLQFGTLLSPNTTHIYEFSTTVNGQETALSEALTLSTLGGTNTPNPTQPAAVADPNTWIRPCTLPVGGTTWTATLTTETSTAGTAGTGTRNATNCSFQYALNNAALGDVIVLTAGATYANGLGSSCFNIPALAAADPTNPNNWLYITTSEDPLVKVGGTLPAYSPPTTPGVYPAVRPSFASFALSGAVASGTTLPNLSSNWSAKTGMYETIFVDSTTKRRYQRAVVYTNGSKVITLWNVMHSIPAGCNATAWVKVGPWVTPTDIPAMATIAVKAPQNSGIGINIASPAQNIRMVGIYIKALAQTPILSGVDVNHQCGHGWYLNGGGTDNIYIDRCGIGSDWFELPKGTLSTFGYMNHGIRAAAHHLLVNQCFCWGLANCTGAGGKPGDADQNFVYGASGNPVCIQGCHIYGAVSEGVIYGGVPIPELDQPGDITYRYNANTKPYDWVDPSLPWQIRMLGTFVKNHFEFKACVRGHVHHNCHQNMWFGFGAAGQGASIGIGSIDQPYGGERGGRPDLKYGNPDNPWVHTTDIDVHDNELWNVAECFIGMNNGATPDPLTYTATLRVQNNVALINAYPSYTGIVQGFIDDGTGRDGSGNPIPSGVSGTVLTVTSVIVPAVNPGTPGGTGNPATGGAALQGAKQSSGGGFTNTIGQINTLGPGGASCGVGQYTVNIPQVTAPTTFYCDNGMGPMSGVRLGGVVPDITFDHNTWIMDTTSTAISNPGSIHGFWQFSYNQTRGQATDRFQMTNNIGDGPQFLACDNGKATPAQDWATYFTNSSGNWSANLPIKDTRANQPAGTLATCNGNYALVGFTNFETDGALSTPLQPLPTTAWNVTTTSHATASTTGGPVGAIL